MNAIIMIAVLTICILGVLIFIGSRYKKVKEAGTAIVVVGLKNIYASKVGAFVWPVVNSHKFVDITDKKLIIIRKGVNKNDINHGNGEYEGIHCKDNIRADLEVAFYIGLDDNEDNIATVANKLGANNIGIQSFLSEYFKDKFSEALKSVVKQFDYEELHVNRELFRTKVKEVLKDDLSGYQIKDVVIDKIDQTSLSAHDSGNILDVQGIRKINEITSQQNIQTNFIIEQEKSKMKKDTVNAEKERLELDKQLKEQEAKTKREIETVRAQEEASISVKKEEERQRSETAKIKADEVIAIELINKEREVETSNINNERVLEIERERVNRAKQSEVVETERYVRVKAEEAEKEVEEQRKIVAEVVSERTKVERLITKEEEETKTLSVKEEADRKKYEEVVKAQAQAESEKVSIVQKAEGDRIAAEEKSKEKERIAQAELIENKLKAEGKSVLAEAMKKEIAAKGLAEAEVLEKMAEAKEKDGLAEVKIKQEMASAIEAEGIAVAKSEAEMGRAKAVADKEKYAAMSSISQETRQHEINKLNIEKDEKVEIAKVQSEKEVGIESAKAMAAGLSKAEMQIIGDENMLNSIKGSMTQAKSIDAKFNNSEVLSALVAKYKNQPESLADDIKEILTANDGTGGAVKNVMLAKLISSGGLDELVKMLKK